METNLSHFSAFTCLIILTFAVISHYHRYYIYQCPVLSDDGVLKLLDERQNTTYYECPSNFTLHELAIDSTVYRLQVEHTPNGRKLRRCIVTRKEPGEANLDDELEAVIVESCTRKDYIDTNETASTGR